MKSPYIKQVTKDLSIPWFEQIRKTVYFPYIAGQQVFYSIKPPDYVTALSRTTEGKYIILKQYRPVVERYTFELPSGHVEEGETAKQAIMRELNEETGCTAKEAILLDKIIPDTGRLENRLWAFYVNNIKVNKLPHPRVNEGIEVHFVSQSQLLDMINEGNINHALDLSVIALAIFQKYLII